MLIAAVAVALVEAVVKVTAMHRILVDAVIVVAVWWIVVNFQIVVSTTRIYD